MQQDNKNKLHVEEDEKHLLLDHDYDGIQELNHPLPNWWNSLFIIGVIFGIFYWMFYSLMDGPTLRDEYVAELAPIQKAQLDYKNKNEIFKPEVYATWDKPENMEKAKVVYEDNCLACHAEAGRGDVGPNLTDSYWLLSDGTPEQNYKVVFFGSEENGMPAWGEVLPVEDIYLALSYINTLKNTNHPEGKEPQGEKVGE